MTSDFSPECYAIEKGDLLHTITIIRIEMFDVKRAV